MKLVLRPGLTALPVAVGLLMLGLTGCTTQEIDTEELPAAAIFKPAAWSDLPGWEADRLIEAKPAMVLSCARISRLDPGQSLGPDGIGGAVADWQRACANVLQAPDDQFRAALERAFIPYRVIDETGDDHGLFTGYYEASLTGSREKTAKFNTPLRGRPDDLVMVQLGGFRDHLKGQRIAGRVIDGQLQPYEDRAAIVAGALDKTAPVIAWVDDEVAAFFLQIQGSGRVRLPDGTTMRVGYAGQNGHPYVPIGRVLIEEGELSRENVSLQTIRDWLKQNPDQADRVMNANPSYVFFREIEGPGPIGGEGVPLTPERSLAIDRSLLPYGAPVFLEVEDPLDARRLIRQLMVAQDTGGAIRGGVRGDFFWGYGPEAEERAGRMKSRGRYWFLLPVPNQPVAAGS